MAKLSLGWNEWAATELAAAGFKVFPCRGEDDAFGKAKTPLGRWTEEATSDIDKLRLIFRRNPKWVPAIKLEDHIVIDPDRHEGPDGIANWYRLIDDKPMPEYVPVVQTPAGQHWYFRQPTTGPKLGNREGQLRGLGINVRGVGGYVIGPRSIIKHKRYDYPFDLETLINAPEIMPWLVEMIQAEPEPVLLEALPARLEQPPFEATERARPYFDAAIGRELDALAGMPKGGRNIALNNAAIRLGNFVNEGRITEAEATALLFQAAEACWLVRDDGANQVTRTIRSGLRGAASKPIKERDISLLKSQATPEDIQARIAEVAAELAPDLILDNNQQVAKYQPQIIKRILMENVTGIIGGQSGVGKTFVAVDLAVCIASGFPFFGNTVRLRGGVLFIAAEGGGDFENRLMAAKRNRGIAERLPIIFTTKTGDEFGGLLNAKNQAERIAAIVGASMYFERMFGVPLRLILIDTVNAAFPLGDAKEDNTYASAVTRVLELIRSSTGISTFAIHHFGKDAAAGIRGGSAYRANVDQVFALLGERPTAFGPAEDTKFIVDKNRYGVEGLGFEYELKDVEIGTDPDGDPITSKIVEMVKEADTKRLPARKEGKGDRSFETAFNSCLDQCAFDWVTPIGEAVRAVLMESVKSRFYDLYRPNPDDVGIEKHEQEKRKDARIKAWGRALKDWKKHEGHGTVTQEHGEILFR